MTKFITKDVVLMSALQVAVAVGGMLLIRQWDERFASAGMQAPFPVSLLANFGLLSLVLPLAWLVWMWRVRLPSAPVGARIRAFTAGLTFVLTLAVLFGCAMARAWCVHAQVIDQRISDLIHHLS